MKTRKSISLTILVAFLSAGAALADVSPARAQLDKYVAAFNAGDWDSIAAFARDGVPKDMVASGFIPATLEIRKELGELDVVDVKELSPYKLTGEVRQRSSGGTRTIQLLVSSESPHRIQSIFID
jgi:hypothetical protein